MKEYLTRLPQEIKDLIYKAQGIASLNNMKAYLVGGCVRDLILGVSNFDLDIAVEGDGIKFAEDLAGQLKIRPIRHRRFGTATLTYKPQLKIDIATARKEFYPEPAHLPVVRPGTLKDDLYRRDFTINAMAISIGEHDFGRLIDFFGGRKDLDKKVIRVLHDLSFIDDPTRILRAIRFEQRNNFKIEPETIKLLKNAANGKMLEKVEPQRIRDDITLMLKEKEPLKEIRRLEMLTGFSFINERLSVSKSTYKLIESIEKQIYWFRKFFPHRRHLDAWLIYLLGLINSLSMNEARIFCNKFTFRKGEEKRILESKRISPKFITMLNQSKIKPSKVFRMLEPLSYEVILFIKAKYKNNLLQRHIEGFFKNLNGMRIHVSGNDLHNFGLRPGPKYEKIFTKVLDAKLDGLVKIKEDELMLIKKMLKK